MRGLWLIPVCFVALAVPVVVLAGGSSGGFDGVVSSIESQYHVHATRIPFLGLVSFMSRTATHGGVRGMHIAEFEHLTGPVDGEELNRIVEEKLGAGWERVVRETSRKGDEQTLVFMHPEGDRMGLFVLDYNNREMDVVQVSVDPDHLSESMNRYGHHHAEAMDHDESE
jgi:hypothetical protein